MSIDIEGNCPMGCGAWLAVVADAVGKGRVRCQYGECPDPDAVDRLLIERARESEHIVVFTEDGWTVQHPLRESVDDGLFDCEVVRRLHKLGGPPGSPGRYRATIHQPDGYSESYRSGDVGLDFEPVT